MQTDETQLRTEIYRRTREPYYQIVNSLYQTSNSSNLDQQANVQHNVATSYASRLRIWNLVNEYLIILEKNFEKVERK